MENRTSLSNRLGSPQIFDSLTQMHLKLPKGYRIYNSLPGIWLGGTEDGRTYLHIERIPASALEMPKTLAQGDLDIKVRPTGSGAELADGITGQDIICTFRSEDYSGQWLRVAFSDRHHYLIILAMKKRNWYLELEDHFALAIAKDIRRQIRVLPSVMEPAA